MLRLSILSGFLAMAFVAYDVPTADACGVKLTVKAPKVKKAVGRSEHPSQVLLLGEPSRKTATLLSESGHKVEVAQEADGARRKKYHVIVADASTRTSAEREWPGVIVVDGDGSPRSVAKRVEEALDKAPSRTLVARAPTRTRESRTPIATGPGTGGQTPIATGGGEGGGEGGGGQVRAGGGETGTRVAEAPARETRSARTAEPAPRETKAAKPPRKQTTVKAKKEKEPTRVADTSPSPSDEPAEAPAEEATDSSDEGSSTSVPTERKAKGGKLAKEIHFPNGSNDLSASYRARLDQTAKWLAANPDKSITVEGHASTTGSADANMAISNSRAEAVKDYLVSQGVDGSRIQTQGFGMERPKYEPGSNGKNRRVEISVQ